VALRFLQKPLYIRHFHGIFVRMTTVVDTNIWGFLAVPVGVLLCFGAALFVWIKDEYFSRPRDDDEGGR
jgi:hypothetical protein